MTQLSCYSLSNLCSFLIWAKVIITPHVQERQFCHDCHDWAVLQRAAFSRSQLWGWKIVVLWHQGNAADKAGRRFKKFLHNFAADWKNFCTVLQLIWKVFVQLCSWFQEKNCTALQLIWKDATLQLLSNHNDQRPQRVVQLLWHFSNILASTSAIGSGLDSVWQSD